MTSSPVPAEHPDPAASVPDRGSAAAPSRADVGVIGGSGFYTFLEDVEHVRVDTPFGEPSDEVALGRVGNRPVAFLARHGRDHRFPPHRVNYRANLWALRALGVRQVLAPCAVGSLLPEQGPGTLAVPDQVIDRTWGRPHTLYDEPGPVVHVPFADPYCPRGRAAVLATAAAQDAPAVDGATLVVINGPRFSSRAESQWHRAAGGTLVGMTGMPEAAIARELALCFTTVALVTDLDAGVEAGPSVTHEEVMRVFARNVDRLKDLLRATIPALPAAEDDDSAACACRRVLDGITLPFALPG
ncbi:MAG TPA: S-methyl-5'-thioadenosine phosphorylase [Segeticoccus sp.]|uniref:S-methyl-5'-thioadenosine phosphorylase n=1 Tax=Segeticoccus sp. TaxID=2706531 RepID=UPI002D7ECBC6|nr:S-methyl-5'-thioadenosine phosphorylase [Segeticoccus sp.]HET8600056.1 S-methyl-5'-thioadenosine phosphorylase [Segeticoccus sp.]